VRSPPPSRPAARSSAATRLAQAHPGACSGLAAFARAALTRHRAARSDDDDDDDEDEVEDADDAELRCVRSTLSLRCAQL
jgi:hypothetical protein